MRFNSKIAEALDIELPEEDNPQSREPMVLVEPHELTVIDNPELPDMTDTERNILEGEKQLEMVIEKGMDMWDELHSDLPNLEPKLRNRHVENMTGLLGQVLDAIKHKTDLQMKKKDVRMKEADFTKKNRNNAEGGAGGTTNNIFVGSREELLKALKGTGQ